jgi:NADH-quinone oxidoreductase subunit A
LFGLVAILVFTLAVFESFVYLIGNGALDWGPVKQLRNMRSMVSADRTATTTVRHVGLEGRPHDGEAA